MKQFEYKTFGISFADDETKLNKLGKEGWEIVTSTDRLLIAKREIESPEPVKKPSGSINGFSR